ncbi:MAG: four helix bundle protein [Rhodothermales bacterium]|nr:four helix bundle protein [Rhodothermales bacterium]
MERTSSPLLDRTYCFAVNVVRLSEQLPHTEAVAIIRRQLLRAATSVAANYRAAWRARSVREFVAKLGMVEEEGDEALFGLDLLATLGVSHERLGTLRQEAHEIVAMVVASKRTARRISC